MGTTTYTIEPGSHALHLEREFDAPAELVLRAYTEPEPLAQWMGPRRLQMRVEQLEPRDGSADPEFPTTWTRRMGPAWHPGQGRYGLPVSRCRRSVGFAVI